MKYETKVNVIAVLVCIVIASVIAACILLPVSNPCIYNRANVVGRHYSRPGMLRDECFWIKYAGTRERSGKECVAWIAVPKDQYDEVVE